MILLLSVLGVGVVYLLMRRREKRLEARMRETTERMEHALEAQKEFVSNIAHELRTPLSGMVGELELALLKPRSTEEYQQLIRLAFLDARRLVRLSNGLLDLSALRKSR